MYFQNICIGNVDMGYNRYVVWSNTFCSGLFTLFFIRLTQIGTFMQCRSYEQFFIKHVPTCRRLLPLYNTGVKSVTFSACFGSNHVVPKTIRFSIHCILAWFLAYVLSLFYNINKHIMYLTTRSVILCTVFFNGK